MFKALNTEVFLVLGRIRRFARRTRDWRRIYALLGDADIKESNLEHVGVEGFKCMETIVASCKAHENFVNLGVAFPLDSFMCPRCM